MKLSMETLDDAARRHGYRSPSSLRAACVRGDIETYRWGQRTILVFPEDVDRYVAQLLRRGGRGRPRRS